MILPKVLKRKSQFSKELKTEFRLLSELLTLRPTKIFFSVLLAFIFGPLLLFLILKPTPAKDIEYGTTFSKKYAEQLGLNWQNSYIKILDELQVKNLRLIVYWDDVEATRDHYNFNDIIWQIEEASKRNAKIILVVGRKVPRYPECFEPQWWKDFPDGNEKDARLYRMIQNAVLTLKNYKAITMWQVENEPFFPFGVCTNIKKEVVQKEISIVQQLDSRPIIVQDSGEGGYWYPSYKLGNYLGISMYRKIWYDFWKIFLGRFIYFEYPLSHWTYKIKADLVGVPYERIIVTELQAEPWGPEINSKLTQEEKDKSMSKNSFIETISYAQKTGFRDLYLWGAEWWLYEKEHNGENYYWDIAKALFNSRN